MLAAFRTLTGNNVDAIKGIDKNKIFVLNRWLSFEPSNYKVTSLVDRLMLGRADPYILKRLLFEGVNKKKKFIKFIKKKKEDQELNIELKKYFKLSSKELEHQQHLINLDGKLLSKMALNLGWNKKQCKKFNVEFKEAKKEKLKKKDLEKTNTKSLFDF